MNAKRVPISEVDVWEKNPRNIKSADFERLKNQIKELGVYKSLICYADGEKYITLVDIVIVDAKTEAMKIKYSLSDNDRAGIYDEQLLAELIYPYLDEINIDDYKIDLGDAENLQSIVEMFGPSNGEDQGKLDEFERKVKIQYPRCGFEFIPGEKEKNAEKNEV